MGSFIVLYIWCWCTGLHKCILYLTLDHRVSDSTNQMAHGVWDKGMSRIYKVILTSRLPSAKLISSITATKFRTSTFFIINELVQHKHVDVTKLSPEWSVVYELYCCNKVLTGMYFTHAGYVGNGLWALNYQDWKTALLYPVVSLSKQSANMAQWLRIVGLVRWKSSRKWIYAR